MEIVTSIFVLLAVYQLKHFLCDYPLQNRYMLGKFKKDWNFIPHLTAHAGVHGVATLLISKAFLGDGFFWIPIHLALFDFVVHFVMDRIKASENFLGRFKALSKDQWIAANSLSSAPTEMGEIANQQLRHNDYFWWAVGFDQMVHHLTHYAIIWIILFASVVL